MSILSLTKDHGFPREWHWKISPMSDGLRLAVAGILESWGVTTSPRLYEDMNFRYALTKSNKGN